MWKHLAANSETMRARRLEEQFTLRVAEGDLPACRALIAEYLKNAPPAGAGDSELIELWCNLAADLRNAFLHEEALSVARLAVAHVARLRKNSGALGVRALTELGSAQVECQMVEQGVQALEAAWSFLWNGLGGADVDLAIDCGTGLAYAYTLAVRYDESNRVLLKCRELIAPKGHSPQYANASLMIGISLGNNLLHQNKYEEGIALCESLIAEAERRNLTSESAYYKVLCLAGSFEKWLNHPDRYLALMQQAISLAEKAKDLPEAIAYRINLIDALHQLEKMDALLLSISDTERFLERTNMSVRVGNIQQLYMNIACVLATHNQPERAFEIIEKVQAACRENAAQGADGNTRQALKIQSQIAQCTLLAKRYREAEELLADCLEKQRATLGPWDNETLSTYHSLASCQFYLGKREQALACLNHILELRAAHSQKDAASYYNAVRLLAWYTHLMGQLDRDLDYMFTYFEGVGAYSYEVFQRFDETAWRKYTAPFRVLMHKTLGWIVARHPAHGQLDPGLIGRAYALVLKYKNLLYEGEMLWKAASNSEEARDCLSDYYALQKKSPDRADEEGLLAHLREKQRIEERMKRLNMDELKSPVSPESLQARLGEGVLAIDFVRYNFDDEKLEFDEPGRTGYLAFVVSRGRISLHDLGDAEDLDGVMEDICRCVPLFQAADAFVREKIALLRVALDIGALLESDRLINTVLLALDGNLMPRMPWQLIFPQCAVRVLPSFARIGRGGRRQSVATRGIVAFANPEIRIDSEDDRRAVETALRITAPCVCSLRRAARREVRAFVGRAASPDVLASVVSPDVLHIAAHGMYCSDRAEFQKSVLFLAGSGSGDMRTDADGLRSRGAVTLLDIMRMDLRGTRLVVLESCESGQGEFRSDEGVYDFVRAFFISGAEAVLTCLWNANALVSSVFVDLFYRAYFSGSAPREALLFAQERVRAMGVKEVADWYEEIRGDIDALEDAARIHSDIQCGITSLKADASGRCFDRPAYWACYTLNTATEYTL
jgi:tetratricopeptide (TPR) repeat protein